MEIRELVTRCLQRKCRVGCRLCGRGQAMVPNESPISGEIAIGELPKENDNAVHKAGPESNS
jgi:hypothetical protein